MPAILNITKNTVIARNGIVADTFLSRMTGLLAKKFLAPGEALIITKCQSIHMFFMCFPIDVIFVDKNDHVIGLVERIKPFQLSPIFFRANYAIEVSEGTIVQTKTSINDKIEVKISKN